jgi:hypothetical protein
MESGEDSPLSIRFVITTRLLANWLIIHRGR